MRQIYPDLWVTEPERLSPKSPDLALHTYLLVRVTGNVLLCRSEHHADHLHMKALGGITHQYLTHWHEAAPGLASIKEMFGSKLACHRLAEEAVSKFSSVDVALETSQDALHTASYLKAARWNGNGKTCRTRPCSIIASGNQRENHRKESFMSVPAQKASVEEGNVASRFRWLCGRGCQPGR
jgi:hypothetical protein